MNSGFNLTEFNPMLANASRIRLDHASRESMQGQVDGMHENMNALEMFRSVFGGSLDQSKMNGMFDMLKQTGFLPSTMVDQAQGMFSKLTSGGAGGLGSNPMQALASLSGGIN